MEGKASQEGHASGLGGWNRLRQAGDEEGVILPVLISLCKEEQNRQARKTVLFVKAKPHSLTGAFRTRVCLLSFLFLSPHCSVPLVVLWSSCRPLCTAWPKLATDGCTWASTTLQLCTEKHNQLFLHVLVKSKPREQKRFRRMNM